jgi:putative methionine-R-sulfoxide reductase with GAF domain
LSETVPRALALAVDDERPRAERARAAAEIVRNARGYRWVGIYDVDDEEIDLLGHTGSTPPEHRKLAVTQGLSDEAVRARSTVVSKTEAIVPSLGAESGIVIGALDAQRERIDGFSQDDVAFLEECAEVLRPLYD